MIFYQVFFDDGTTLDLETLIEDSEGHPVKGITIDGDSIWIGSYKYIIIMSGNNDGGQEC